MSDVSGIPNMGFGGGNFFAPSFSYNPQMSAGQASAAYMPAENYAQNVVNNLYTGGGFGAQTANYAATGAAYGRQIAYSWDNPYREGGVPESMAYPGAEISGGRTTGPGQGLSSITSGDFGSPEWSFTNPSDRPAYQAPWDYSGGSFNLPSHGGGMSDFQSPSNNYNTFQGGWGNVGNNFNLGAGGTPEWSTLFPSGGSSGGGGGISWDRLFGGSGGAPRNDPSPGMAMPGGIGSPMTVPQQQPAAAGGSIPYTSGIEPDQTGGMAMPTSTPAAPSYGSLGGNAFGVGDNAPSYDRIQQAFRDLGTAQGGTDLSAPTMPSSDKLLGYEPKQWPVEFDPNTFVSPANQYDQFQAPATQGGGGQDTDLSSSNKSADTLAEEARQKLAGLLGGTTPEEAAKTTKAVEAGPYDQPSLEEFQKITGPVPMPRERPEGADVERPPADIPPQDLVPLAGRNMKFELAGVNPRFAKALQEFTRDYNASQDDYSMALRSGKGARDKGFHATGNAVDVNLIDRRNGERLTDYQTRDPVVFKAYQDNANAFHAFLEKNYPDLAEAHRWGGYFSGDTSVYGAQDIMHHDLGGRYGRGMAGGSWAGGLGQQEADTWGLPYGGGTKTPYPQFNFDWSNAPIPDVGPMPLTYKSQGGGSVYQIDPTTGQRYSPPMGGKDKMGELSSRDFTPAAPIDGVRERSGLNEGQEIPRPPADVPSGTPFVNDGTPFGPPAPPGYTGKPAGPSGVEKAQTFLNTSVDKLLQQYAPDKAGPAGMFIDTQQPLRDALKGPYGDRILTEIQPELGRAGLTRSDFAKAVANPAARFMGGGNDDSWTPQERTDKWNTDVYNPLQGPVQHRDEGAIESRWSDFARPGNVEDRRFDPALTGKQEDTLRNRGPGVPNGSYIENAQDKLPIAGGALGEMLGTKEISAIEQGRNELSRFAPSSSAGPTRAMGDGASYDDIFAVNDAAAPEPTSMRDFPSPANDYNTFQKQPFIEPWQASIPAGRNGPEVVDAIKALAARLHTDPAEIAAMIQQETHDSPSALWNPQITPNRYGYRGLTQMGTGTFNDAARMGTSIGNFPTIEDYQRGTGEQQIDAYGDWLDLYTRQQPQGAAALINSGALAGLPPGEAAAIMQGAQFAPNATSWVNELQQGNMNVPTTATPQAPELRPYTINAMADAARRHMAAWPQQQLWSNYNMPPRPGGY